MEGISSFSIIDSFSKIYINGTQNVKWVLFEKEMKMRAFGDDNQVEVGILKEGVYKLLITYEKESQKVLNVRKVII